MKRTEYDKIIPYLVEFTYDCKPSLVPFSGGDRASLLGKEDAEAFAQRKWREFRRNPKGHYPRKRGPNPIAKRNYVPGSVDYSPPPPQPAELP